jgi:hypothetical protein
MSEDRDRIGAQFFTSKVNLTDCYSIQN